MQGMFQEEDVRGGHRRLVMKEYCCYCNLVIASGDKEKIVVGKESYHSGCYKSKERALFDRVIPPQKRPRQLVFRFALLKGR